ncbi:Predicted acetyltransferase [Actinobacillus pleuropneumoniae]|nr:Predicted acetyltransferase [Actinobacillus pleuropneumoniae]
MHINLVPVDLGKKDILFNLYQLYYYDFSEYTNQRFLSKFLAKPLSMFKDVVT